MESFSIRDVENLSGIKAHTWRIWEQRYPAFHSKRESSKHRVYDVEDLRRLLRIAFLYHNGWKISRIAQLSTLEVLEEGNKIELNERNYQTYILQLIVAVFDFNEKEFDRLLHQLIEKVGFEEGITGVCYPFLQRIGLLWMTHKIVPAQEHFSILMIRNRIIAETEKLNKPSQPAELLLFSPEESFGDLPLLYLNYLLRKHGWSVIFLGSDTKLELLQQFRSNLHVQYLFLHQTTNSIYFDADDYLEVLCRAFGDKKIIASGALVQGVQRTFINLTLLRSDREILEFVGRGL